MSTWDTVMRGAMGASCCRPTSGLTSSSGGARMSLKQKPHPQGNQPCQLELLESSADARAQS